MASKNEYYDRIISSLQSDLTSQKTEIFNLKSTVARQQKEIEDLKALHIPPQNQQVPQQTRISVEKLLKEVKRVCDEAIKANYDYLPTIFADRQDFATFRKSAEQKFLSADTFNAYKRSQEIRLKTIEKKLTRHFSIFSVSRISDESYQTRNTSFNFNAIIQFFKSHNLQWLFRILVTLAIALFALYIFNTIKL